MTAEERNRDEQQTSQKSITTAVPVSVKIRSVKDARELFAAFAEDEQELNHAATTFIKLGTNLSGRNGKNDERAQIFRSYYEQIVLDPATKRERSNDEKWTMLRRTLAEMRELSRALHSSPQAHQAHLDVDSYTHATDDLRTLFEVPDDHTRAEHAGYLNINNREARDLFERGAELYGDILIIPREASSGINRADQIRLDSLSHAVKEFAPLVGDGQAKIKAAEFIELGRQIAGRTADSDTRLITFRAFYQDIKRDEMDGGRARTQVEQAEQLEPVLDKMRVLAAAMRELEWKREPHEFISLEDWERSFEVHQRDAELETHGHLTFHLDNVSEYERSEEREEKELFEVKDLTGRDVFDSSIAQVEYERIPLKFIPPRLPEGLTTEAEERLRYEIMPRLDRQIESGVPPKDILRGLALQVEKEARHNREQEIARLLLKRAPEANQEHPLTREEEARALYTLHALNVIDTDEIKQRGFTPQERATAIDTVGGRLAQDYRDTMNKLKTFDALESERARLNDEALQFRVAQRSTSEFQSRLAASHKQTHDNYLSELEALTRGNNAHFTFISRAQAEETKYPELTGEQRPLPLYAKRHAENEDTRRATWRQLESFLISPDIERAQSENDAHTKQLVQRFRRITGREIGSAEEARKTLTPQLLWERAVLDGLAEERSSLNVERLPRKERHANPLYVGMSSLGGDRLPVESINEYRTLRSVAEGVGRSIHAFAGKHGREITGFDALGREQEFNFARDYVAYRQLDGTTRLLNNNRLFREFNTRLGEARSADELRAAIKEIRQDNFSRGRFPERYQSESDDTLLRIEQARRPLTEIEMRSLMLSPGPAHYTAEMRELRLNYSISARDKAERIKGLEQGRLAPSPSLKLLLAEFERTKSDNLAQYGRNIKSFLADYLNPPTTNRNRFSAQNLYDLHQKLSPTERDYLFKVVDGTKQAVISSVSEQWNKSERSQSHEFDQTAHAGGGRREERVGESPQIKALPAQQGQEINKLREKLEEKVAAYLVSVVERRGDRAFESNHESLHHAAQVTNIIKETLAENGRLPKELDLTHERISHVAGKLIGELPYVLRDGRDRMNNENHTHGLIENSHAALSVNNTLPKPDKFYEHEVIERMGQDAMRRAVAPVLEHDFDNDVVEQKINSTIGHIHKSSAEQFPVPAAAFDPHQPRAHELSLSPKEHVRQRTLSR